LQNYGGGCHQKLGISVHTTSYGRKTFIHGEEPNGKAISKTEFDPSLSENYNKSLLTQNFKFSLDEIWPNNTQSAPALERTPLDVTKPKKSWFFVARSEAWPESWGQSDRDVVWTAGVKTWQKLAKRGVWVTGTSDGEGEPSKRPLEKWFGDVSGYKLSHKEGIESEGMNLLPTYEIQEPLWDAQDLVGKKCFYWASGSQFLRAIKLQSSIVNGVHCCGPGHTYRVIKTKIQDSARVVVFPDQESWMKWVVRK
jgi:hydroxymethylbilane synthase